MTIEHAILLLLFALLGFNLGILLGKMDKVTQERTGNFLSELLNREAKG